MSDPLEQFNEAFKAGRRAGQEDVAKEILRSAPSSAKRIARQFLAQHETPAVLAPSDKPRWPSPCAEGRLK